MKLFHGSKIRSLIIGLICAKIFIAGCYLLETLKPIHLAHLNTGVAESLAEFALSPNATAQAAAPSGDPATAASGSQSPTDTPLLQPKDIQAVMDTLNKQRRELQQKKAQLQQEKARLDALKLEIEDKISTLTKIQKKIEADLNRKQSLAAQAQQKAKAEAQQHIRQLVKVYASMKPRNAAAIVDKMDLKVVFEIFRAMKGNQVGRILTYVNRDRAATISEWLADKKGQ